jgi:hypothetical protein
MVKWKILLMVGLYIILAFVAYFNFGFHDLMIQKLGGKGTPTTSTWKKLEENIKNTQAQIPQEFQDPSADQEMNNSEREVDN